MSDTDTGTCYDISSSRISFGGDIDIEIFRVVLALILAVGMSVLLIRLSRDYSQTWKCVPSPRPRTLAPPRPRNPSSHPAPARAIRGPRAAPPAARGGLLPCASS